MSYYKTLTCFDTEVPSSGSRSAQRNVAPAQPSSYYVALTEVVKILSIKIFSRSRLKILIRRRTNNILSLNNAKEHSFSTPHHPTRYTAQAPLGYTYIPSIIQIRLLYNVNIYLVI
jgi:hypothetical protein